MYIFGANMDI